MNKKKIHSAFLTKAWPGANRMTLFIIYSQASNKSHQQGFCAHALGRGREDGESG